MLNYESLAALEAIVRSGSFNKAASALHITQSAISQRIRSLENAVGEPLLSRSSPPKATAMGQRLIRHFHEVSLLEQELSLGAPAGERRYARLGIGVNADSVATWFPAAVLPLLRKREWTVAFTIENEWESLTLLQHGQVMGCVSTSSTPLPGCSLEALGKMKYLCLARKSFAKKFFSDGFTLQNILNAPAVIFNEKDMLHEKFIGKLFRKKQLDFPRYEMPSSEGFVEIVKDGLAYGLVPELQSRELIEKGMLVDLAPGHDMQVPLYWHYSIREPQPLKAFRKEFVERAREFL